MVIYAFLRRTLGTPSPRTLLSERLLNDIPILHCPCSTKPVIALLISPENREHLTEL